MTQPAVFQVATLVAMDWLGDWLFIAGLILTPVFLLPAVVDRMRSGAKRRPRSLPAHPPRRWSVAKWLYRFNA